MQEQGWVTAINLREGDTIETMDGFVHITKVERTRHEEAIPVYNFHVKDWVSYFVGKIKCYVHNGKVEEHGISLSKYNGLKIKETISKKGMHKVEYLFENLSDAMNCARNMLGHDATKIYNKHGKRGSWSGSKGKVYWGMAIGEKENLHFCT